MKNRPKLFLIIVFIALLMSMLACATNIITGDTHADRGIEAYGTGEYDTAIKELEQALEAGVTRYEREKIHTMLGNIYNDLGLFDQAITEHEKAIDLNPEFHEAWVNLGIVYRLLGELDRAEECYNKALSIEPDYPELHASIGVLYMVKGEPKQAIEALENAVGLDPQLAGAHGNLALAYAMIGRFDDAEASLQQATALGYENWEAIHERINSLKAQEEE